MVLKHKQKPITDDRLLLTTKETARLLGYAEQTLRKWALYENGPINPIRHGRSLRWSKAEVYKFACSQGLCCTNLSVKGFSAI